VPLTEDECRNAPRAHPGVKLHSHFLIDVPWDPKGCFEDRYAYVYYNSHPTGSANKYTYLLCKRTLQAPMSDFTTTTERTTATTTRAMGSASDWRDAEALTARGGLSSNACPEGSVPLTEEECGLLPGDHPVEQAINVPWYPSGCFRDDVQHIYFNEHETGKANDYATPLCKLIAEVEAFQRLTDRRRAARSSWRFRWSQPTLLGAVGVAAAATLLSGLLAWRCAVHERRRRDMGEVRGVAYAVVGD